MASNENFTPEVIQHYKQIMSEGLSNSFPGLNLEELNEAIDWSIKSRLYNGKAEISNNYERTKIDGTVLDILKYIEYLQPIKTSSGVLFRRHKEMDNPLSKMINGFLDKRAGYKKMMFKYPKGSAMFEKYNLYQLLEKLNANATYGVLGAPTSLYYNIYVAEAITRQGRSYISCSIMLFESLLSNNVKFNSLNEAIVFINNVVHEKQNRKCIDSQILDRDITLEECFYKVCNTIDPLIWTPTEKELSLIWEYLRGLSNEDLNRIYYKNNLYTFCDLPIISDLLIKILTELEEPYMDCNNPPKEIKEDLETFRDLVKEYVYYPHIYVDKLDRIEYMQRDIVIISDTDSTIISFDAWYRYMINKVYNIDMPIKHEKFDMVDVINADEFGDRPLKEMCEIVEPELDYNFYTDEVIDKERYIEPAKLIPQETLKYAIINIMGYICSQLVVDYLGVYCKLCGSEREGLKTKMIMKSEFFFDRILLTDNRRNYADIQTVQEGNIIPVDQRMAIMGLPIDKSTLSDNVKKDLQKILYEDIMTADNIDQVKIMKHMVLMEKQIYDSIVNKKETKYYKPDNVAPMSSYAKKPLEVNGVVACMIYNEIKDPDMPTINLDERNSIFKVKVDINKKNVSKIKDTYPEVYEKLLKLLDHPTLGSKLNTIGFPQDSKVPDWVFAFVDYNSIVSDALKNFPLASVGLNRLDNDSVNYSNIVKL